MFNPLKHKKRLGACLALTASFGAAAVTGSAHADPIQYTALVGVGSDTTQDVMNALSGNSGYAAAISTSGGRQEISFDAIPAGSCITAKIGGPQFTRPNGSSQGRRALSRAIDGTGYGTAACGGPVNIAGQVDFARSSAGPAAGDVGTALTYIPFGRDGVSFAYYRAAGSPVTTLTRAQLTALFKTGPQTINGVNIVPCGIQTGSGTYAFFNTVTGATTTEEDAATTACNGYVGGRAEENDGAALKARGDAAPAGTQVVIGFSAASFIAKSNGVAPGAPPAGVGIGSISDNGSGTNLGSPTTGTAPNLAPSSTFFSDAVFGRNVYNVFPTNKVTGPGNSDIKGLFVGSTSGICTKTATITQFGFQNIADCGSTTLKGSLFTGQL